jgi:hypothetical protein
LLWSGSQGFFGLATESSRIFQTYYNGAEICRVCIHFRTAYLRIANALAQGRRDPSLILQEFLGDKNLFCGLGLQTDCKQPLHPPRHSRLDNRASGSRTTKYAYSRRSTIDFVTSRLQNRWPRTQVWILQSRSGNAELSSQDDQKDLHPTISGSLASQGSK